MERTRIVKRKRGKRWCATLNNYTPDELSDLIALGEDCSKTDYLIVGKEIGDQGTPHLQIYFECSQRIGIREAKNLVGSRCHLEIARGSAEENREYCSKEGNFAEWGTSCFRKGSGVRSDLIAIQEEIKKGKSEADIAERYFTKWCIYRKSFTQYASILQEDRRWKSKVIVYWGPTGTGKTRRVHEKEENRNLWISCDPSGKWFDGYVGQEAVLFDDFASGIEFRFLLLLLDRYPLSVPIKGGFTKWNPRRIYITSNLQPSEWYPFLSQEEKEPLHRRLDKIIQF